jgi:cystathionine beta-lyase family protein involved in aluminum resistance
LKANDYFAKVYGFDKKIIEFVTDAESMLSEEFESVHSVCEANQLKVIKAFQD